MKIGNKTFLWSLAGILSSENTERHYAIPMNKVHDITAAF